MKPTVELIQRGDTLKMGGKEYIFLMVEDDTMLLLLLTESFNIRNMETWNIHHLRVDIQEWFRGEMDMLKTEICTICNGSGTFADLSCRHCRAFGSLGYVIPTTTQDNANDVGKYCEIWRDDNGSLTLIKSPFYKTFLTEHFIGEAMNDWTFVGFVTDKDWGSRNISGDDKCNGELFRRNNGKVKKWAKFLPTELVQVEIPF